MKSYIVGDKEMQIVDTHYDGSVEVYNFKSSYDSAHSHIHYDKYGRKTIYRDLNNPDKDAHEFYPLEQYAISAKQESSIYNFPFDFESLMNSLNLLSKEQLEKLLVYLKYELSLNNEVVIEKTR
mgnify:CR=1 FL=1